MNTSAGFSATVTDQDIARGVEALLRQSPSNAVNSLHGVVHQLGALFGQDLSHKSALIHQALLHFHQYYPLPLHKDHFALQHYPNYQHSPPSHFPFAPPPPPPPPVAPQPRNPPSPHPKAAPKKSPKESGQVGVKRRGGAGGLNKVCGVSPELEVVVGDPLLPRTEIVKKLWAYIRKNNLQDPSNKRKIICDEALRAVFEIDCTDMFKMNKLLSKHIHSLESPKESAPSKRVKIDGESSAENPESATSLVTISEPLAMFLGIGKKEMLQSEATQYILEYIKVNQLEDPNTTTVMCDLKLRELFGCESTLISEVPGMLARHHLIKS